MPRKRPDAISQEDLRERQRQRLENDARRAARQTRGRGAARDTNAQGLIIRREIAWLKPARGVHRRHCPQCLEM